ncbi:baculoviral IAP repeat-containing protein 7-like isoform X2 [Littorina saxatilis]|uniref:baculoviral IAP repeat-containing protein 7-like isoform X2 n=1 Tax=Littorina saxatilis TaxID=31220 RepID=UPI0038B4A515
MTELIGRSSGPEAFAPIPPDSALSRRSFNEEKVRLASYNSMAPLEGCQCHPILMAKGGLYYTGPDDAVRCYSCSTILTTWRSQGVDPNQLHRQSAPQCAHVRELDGTNVPIIAPDAATTETIKEWLREKCAELDRNPTQVYYDLSRTFSEIGGVSRGEMFGSDPDLESSGPAALVPPEGAQGLGEDEAEIRVDRSHLSASSGIDFELCKSSITERLKTFENWPLAAQVYPQLLSEAGFVYTGPQDRVQCVYCEGSLRNWQEGDVPSNEHARHFPTCPMVRDNQMTAPAPVVGPSVSFGERSRHTPPISLTASDGPGVTAHGVNAHVTRQDLLGIVTDRPKHPSMSIEAARIGSYTSWPTGKSQTPQQLSHAGFFYAGFNDSVKCFFCDGGLRNWEREDDPWHEHARWFPRCKYVRQVKGDKFVEDVLSEENGRVQQTAVYEGPARGSNSPVVCEGERSRRRSGSTGRESSERRQPVEQREVMARMDTPMVRAVLNMDIPQDIVRRALEHRLRNTGDDFPNMEALLETVFELSASHPARHASSSGEPSPVNTGSPVRRPGSGEPLAAFEAPRSLIEENRQLKEQRTCKICMDEEVCVVFVPCGHLVCCATCAPPLSKCPICRSTIRGTVRTYMS